MIKQVSRNERRKAKHLRIKNKMLKNNPILPRVFVYKSLQNFSAQLFDNQSQRTILALDTRKNSEYSGNIAAAAKLGHEFGKLLLENNYKTIQFDRSGYIFHGRVKAFADAMREEGVQF